MKRESEPINKYTLDQIILLKENLPEPTLTAGVVLQIELIKTMKCTFVCMNIQKVHVQVVPVKINVRGVYVIDHAASQKYHKYTTKDLKEKKSNILKN